MADTQNAALPQLDGPMIEPASGGAPKQLVLFLHGVGADGNDLLGLAPMFQDILPDAVFVSPNAPFAFDMAPYGFQWFSIGGGFGPERRLNGARIAGPILEAFIDRLLAQFGLADKDLVLIGFSQGTMMSLHVGLRRAKPVAGIVGFSGMLAGEEVLAAEIRSRPPVLLIHGDADPVLPVAALPAAVKALEAVKVPVEHHIHPGLAHGIDEEGIHQARAFVAKVFGKPPPR
jgi:phospholipase/carboxylesterase